MLTGLKVSSLAWKYVSYRTKQNAKGDRILEVLKCKNKIYQLIELEEYMKKNGLIFLVIMFTSGVLVIKMSKKWLILCIFCRRQQNISHSLGKTFKCT